MDETKNTLDKKNSLFTNTTSLVEGIDDKKKSPNHERGGLF
jgi:hypothetical protein